MTSILGIPNDPALPSGSDPEWFPKWRTFLGTFGLVFHYEMRSCWREGYWIASVPSLNCGDGVTHAIVMHDTHWIFHDPSTAKRYEAGTSLCGKDVVLGGYYLEVTDSSKLGALVDLAASYSEIPI